MARKKKVLGYSDRNYQQKKQIYDCIMQVIDEIKYGATAVNHSWSLPVELIRGLTVRLVNGDRLEITSHHQELGTPADMARLEEFGKSFLVETEREIKKKFKKLTGKALKLKKVKEDRSLEKVSRLQTDVSWLMGTNVHGHPGRLIGRFLIRDTRVYDFSADL